jgi:hypothetical protein
MKLLIKELNPKLWGDLERLFGEKGAWGGCWCMYLRIEQGGPVPLNSCTWTFRNAARD